MHLGKFLDKVERFLAENQAAYTATDLANRFRVSPQSMFTDLDYLVMLRLVCRRQAEGGPCYYAHIGWSYGR